MDFQEKLQKCRNEIYNKVSTKNITFLKDFESVQNLRFNKNGKYYYYTSSFGDGINIGQMDKFLNILKETRVYVIIPLLSKNNTADEPLIILSRQILVSKCSDNILLTNYINDTINKAIDLYEMNIENFNITFKYKQIEFTIEDEFK